MNKLKILSLVIGKPKIGYAATTRILSILDGLKNKSQIRIVSFSKGSHSYISNFDDYDIQFLPIFNPFKLMNKYVEILMEYQPDIILAHTQVPAFMASIINIIRMRNIPLIFDMHGFHAGEIALNTENTDGFLKYIRLLLYSLMERIAIKSSVRILCVSHNAVNHMINMMGVNSENLIYFPNGVDLTYFKPLGINKNVIDIKRKLRLDNKFIFGYIGNYQKWQGVENFLEAALSTNDTNIGFLVVGGKTSWAKRNIINLQRVPKNQIPYFYSMCDVLVLPRPYHIATDVAAPTKFAEYTAMGKPVLVTNVGDAALLTKKYKCGIVIENNNPSTLENGFFKFMELSKQEILKMGYNSRKLAEEEFDLNKIIQVLNFEIFKSQ